HTILQLRHQHTALRTPRVEHGDQIVLLLIHGCATWLEYCRVGPDGCFATTAECFAAACGLAFGALFFAPPCVAAAFEAFAAGFLLSPLAFAFTLGASAPENAGDAAFSTFESPIVTAFEPAAPDSTEPGDPGGI